MNTPDHPSMNPCEQLKERLAEHGEVAVREHPVCSEHLADCSSCQRLLKAWSEIPELLDQLPDHEPGPALSEAVITTASPGELKNKPNFRRFIAPSLASAAVLLAAVGLSRELLLLESPKAPVEWSQLEALERAQREAANRSLGSSQVPETKEKNERGNDGRGSELATPDTVFKPQPPPAPAKQDVWGEDSDRTVFSDAPSRPQAQSMLEAELRKDRLVEQFEPTPGEFAAADRLLTQEQAAASQPGSPRSEGAIIQGRKKASDKNVLEIKGGLLDPRERDAIHSSDERRVIDGLDDLEESAVMVTGNRVGIEPFNFLSHYDNTDSISTQPAIGYWANTHIPGDPAIRLMHARLAQWDRSWLQNNAGLEQTVRPVQQPFDAPSDNALALSLMSDVSTIGSQAEPTRLRLQVGIQGIEHRRGQRPAMNLSVVLDLPPKASDDVRIAARALLDGLLQARQAGDRFSLVMTGKAGQSLVVEADDFRFGSLQLAKQLIAGETTGAVRGKGSEPDSASMDVYTAMQRAGELVRRSDDPGQPLGSSSVWLIGAQSPGQHRGELDQLVTWAHQQARDGITTSVFPLGDQLSTRETEALVLAGLGSRRYLEAPAQARSLVEEELNSASRAVARAVRLSIRLAPGVELIKVIGSERLDTPETQRVRDIENSMDRRLSANLGIQADRGEDEDGIQIVIPGIYSGDSAIILLDLITNRPGAIAEVSLRYKDLVYLSNGSLSAKLVLPGSSQLNGQENRGPAELSVLKNLLSWHFSKAVEQAADALGQHQPGQAVAILRAMVQTIEQARQDVPTWHKDPDLIRDQQVLERYITALESPEATSQQSFLADSLRLAAWAKTHPMPMEWK